MVRSRLAVFCERIWAILAKRYQVVSTIQQVRHQGSQFHVEIPIESHVGAICRRGEYEPALKRFAADSIKKGGFVVDIGANVGLLTVIFGSLVGENGKVLAFEPIKDNYKFLLDNVRRNRLTSIVEARNLAIGLASEQRTIQVPHGHGEYATLLNNDALAAACEGNEREISVVRLDDEVLCLPADEPVSFIKVDVEGFEPEVFFGGLEVLRRDKPKIVFEYNPHYVRQRLSVWEELWRCLKEIGYGLRDLESGLVLERVDGASLRFSSSLTIVGSVNPSL